MKSMLSVVALASLLAGGGVALAEEAMSTPMQGEAMAGDAMSPMSADETLEACLAKARMEADSMKQDEAAKACNDAHNAMVPGGDAMMSSEPMAGGDAMAPKAQ